MNMQFFYLANEHSKIIKDIEACFSKKSSKDERFFTLLIGLEYMVSAHLAEITGWKGFEIDDLDDFIDVTTGILNAETEKEIDEIILNHLEESKKQERNDVSLTDKYIKMLELNNETIEKMSDSRAKEILKIIASVSDKERK